jgi:SAM-dependent methyltransferase/uncharacterized protein YbaR (Trm112 family)
LQNSVAELSNPGRDLIAKGVAALSPAWSVLFSLLCCPETRQELRFFRLNDTGKIDGLLVSHDGTQVYPIIENVPVMLPRSVPARFVQAYPETIGKTGVDINKFVEEKPVDWSFSHQWAYFDSKGVERTWGWTTQSRLEMFFYEVQRTPEELKDLVVLDAGCGNGLLTEMIGGHAKLAIGLDYSASVFANAARCKADNVVFVRGDLQKPPFKADTLDVIFSSGVLHHTPSTAGTFKALAKCVAPGGSFYIWLYRISYSGNIFVRALRRTVLAMRPAVAPLPRLLQTPILYAHAFALMMWGYVRHREKRFSYAELFIGAHDSLTPKYRTMHNPTEVAEWYFEAGFTPPTLTHWDNASGFGITGRKVPSEFTPGVNFDKPRGTVQRYGL